MYQKYIKRWLDIILSFGAIAIFWPHMVFIAILIKINLGKLVIFSQFRPGKDEKFFKIYHFRSMTDEKEKRPFIIR